MWMLAGSFLSHTSLPMRPLPVTDLQRGSYETDGCPVITEQRRAQFVARLHAPLPSNTCVQPGVGLPVLCRNNCFFAFSNNLNSPYFELLKRQLVNCLCAKSWNILFKFAVK